MDLLSAFIHTRRDQIPGLFQAIWARRFGEPGLFSAPKLTDFRSKVDRGITHPACRLKSRQPTRLWLAGALFRPRLDDDAPQTHDITLSGGGHRSTANPRRL